MKKVFWILVLAVLTYACGMQSGNEVKIGFLIHTVNSARWSTDMQFVEQRAKELGVEVIFKSAEHDENLQLTQATELLAEGVDVLIVVAANQNTAAGIVREAHLYDVPVIAYDRMVRNSDLDYIISFEYEKVGKIMVDYAVAKVPVGNYVVFWGDASDGNAVFVKNAQQKALQTHVNSGNIKLIYSSFIQDWLAKNSKHQMDRILDYSDKKIDVVLASNDPMALGACESLLEHGYDLNNVIVTGQDATLYFIRSLMEGGMTMSVDKPIRELAFGAVDAAVQLANNKEPEGFNAVVFNGRVEVPAKLFSPQVVDKDNIEEELIETGEFSWEQIRGN